MPTIDPNELPKPVTPGQEPTAAPPPPPGGPEPAAASAPTDPAPDPSPTSDTTTRTAAAGNGRKAASLAIVAIVAVVGVIVLAIGAGVVVSMMGGDDDGAGASSPAARRVESYLNYDASRSESQCLASELDDAGLDPDGIDSGMEADTVAAIVLDCIDTSDLAAAAARTASDAYGVEADCVEESFNDAGTSTWRRYLEAFFSGDTSAAADIEVDVFGHC